MMDVFVISSYYITVIQNTKNTFGLSLFKLEVELCTS